MAGKGRANGEGSIYPFRNGFAAYVWVTTPTGEKKRKYVYGPTREVGRASPGSQEWRSGVRKITVHDGRRSCGTLLVDLDVHPRVIMRILRHAQFSMTMEIYSQASSKKTRDTLKRLGESLDE
ncbi:hypothetical protein ABZ863_29925 [Saccharomonospora sp. NPDC046836]|uniref:hypothetical protein n=1 Tax=Saccharomonospora sp. NPDC046836 TaxID=3156921 RepID=UPI00340A2DBD